MKILRSVAEIDTVGADWRALEHVSADPLSYFQSFDWCRHWVAQFADANHKPHIITLWRDRLLLGVVPLMQTRGGGLQRLESLGGTHSQYCGAILRQGVSKDRDVVEALRLAVRASGCDVWVQRAVVADGGLDNMISGIARVRHEPNFASMLDLSTYSSAPAYFDTLGKLQKRNRNRRRNHLARSGELQFEVIGSNHPQFKSLVAKAVEWKQKWLHETGRMSVGFSARGYAEFLQGLEGDPEALSGALVSVLRAGDRVVALELGFAHFRHYYAYIGSFDWDLRDLSPGKVQMELTIGWLIDHGARAYDLLVNPADYKNSWTNKTIPVATRAKPLTWKGRIYTGYWLPKIRPLVKRLYEQLPQLVQRCTGLLQGSVCLLLYV